MSRGSRKKNAQARIAMLEVKKRNGLLIFAAAIVAMVVLISLKLFYQYQVGAIWASSELANIGMFISAIIAAAFAGAGTRKWKKARDEIRALESGNKKKR